MEDDETPDAVDADFGIQYNDDGSVQLRVSALVRDEIPEELQPQLRYVFERNDVVHFIIPSPEAADDARDLFEGGYKKIREAHEAAVMMEKTLGDDFVNVMGEFFIAAQKAEEDDNFDPMEKFLEKLLNRNRTETVATVTTLPKETEDGE